MSGGVTRRDFVRGGSLYGAGLWLSLRLPRPATAAAAAASSAPVSFSAHEWETVEAITSRILPSDHQPGALEAGCVNFIDKALANEDAAARPLYTDGLQALDAVCTRRFAKPFVALEPAQRDGVLAALETGSATDWPLTELPSPLFFETLRLHTIVGFLADPEYGGNRDYAGWRVSGYPGPRHRLGGYLPEQLAGTAPIVPVWQREQRKAR
ncbi:MAG: gluconate 2-dehydrogenase subunit 3 family protein [Myxococcota bacterium]|nr:gluconate 2-dehydrogenase subunit 3 family protein [Myxococcota bacterium]